MEKIILSSTHVDSHNTRIALSALQGMAEQINGNEKIKWTVEHDMSLPPLGIIDNAEVVQGEDGEHYLHAELVPYDNSYILKLPDDTVLKKEAFDQPISFRENIEDNAEKVIISFDPVNVGDDSSLMNLFEEIRNETSLIFEERSFFRKSLIPDPEVLVQITNHIVEVFFAYKIVEKATDKLQEKLVEDFYDLVKITAKKAAKRLIPLNKKITYIFKGNYSGVLFELLTQTRSAEALLEYISTENLYKIAQLIDSCKHNFQAIKVQLMYDLEKNAWELNYLIDVNGSVVGSIKSFDRRRAVINNMTLDNHTNN